MAYDKKKKQYVLKRKSSVVIKHNMEWSKDEIICVKFFANLISKGKRSYYHCMQILARITNRTEQACRRKLYKYMNERR